ncbi:hypothetical protein B296_00025536 [Ensete ventricosum]|uniref:Uncharacterized protein n=1 Tax=Ensete ventricosum TaxID=4639 RepID=A0A426Y3G9_ENSVE|nr:hypothetical protein B296_00025536 [Ensete ventricosum]
MKWKPKTVLQGIHRDAHPERVQAVGTLPGPRNMQQVLNRDVVPLPNNSNSVGSTAARSAQSAFETSLTSPQIDGSAQDLILSTLIGNLKKVFTGGGGEDRADGSAQDLILSTLIGNLKKVFTGGGGDDRANIDLAVTSSCPRTTRSPTWSTQHSGAGLTQAAMKYDGMVSNRDSKDLRYKCLVAFTIKTSAPPRSKGITKLTTKLT